MKIKSLAKKTADIGFIIRTAACALAFLGATAYFFNTCAALANNYLTLLTPSKTVTIPWLIQIAVSATLWVLLIGASAALIRPLWLGFLNILLGAILFPLILGPSMSTGIAALVILLLLSANLIFISSQMKNQIRFSTHPLGDNKALIGSLIAVLVCIAFGLGYVNDSAKRNYVLPPEATAFFNEMMMKTAKAQIDAQKAPEALKNKALQEAEAKFKTMITDAEAKVKPSQKYIPVVLGITAFFILQIPFLFLILLAGPLTPLLFLIFKLIRFSHFETEKVEAKRLTLKSVG